jgi:hypothetical protein
VAGRAATAGRATLPPRTYEAAMRFLLRARMEAAACPPGRRALY